MNAIDRFNISNKIDTSKIAEFRNKIYELLVNQIDRGLKFNNTINDKKFSNFFILSTANRFVERIDFELYGLEEDNRTFLVFIDCDSELISDISYINQKCISYNHICEGVNLVYACSISEIKSLNVKSDRKHNIKAKILASKFMINTPYTSNLPNVSNHRCNRYEEVSHERYI